MQQQALLISCVSLYVNGYFVGKGKVVPLHGLKVYGGVEVQLHVFLTTYSSGGAFSASRTRPFIVRERGHVTRWVGCWVDSGEENRKISCVPRGSENDDTLSVQPAD